MERKGTSTERGDEQRAVRARNQERRELTQQLRDISARIAETMRTLGDKAKGMAQGLRDRLGAAWGRQDQAADRGAAERIAEDRKRVVEGKGVSGRVVIGGRRYIKKIKKLAQGQR